MKRFKAKKKRKPTIYYFIIIVIIFFSFNKLVLNDNLKIKNTLLNYLIRDNLGTNDINDVEFLLKYALNINYSEENKEVAVLNNIIKKEEVNIKRNEPPTIYLYSTHQKETYKSTFLSGYNIESSVLQASKILKEYLKNLNLTAIVEESDLVAKRNSLDLSYGSSYKVSRVALEEAKKNNQTLKYFLDIHRDSGSHEKTTLTKDGVSYAKLLLVVGLDNPTYQNNLVLAEKFRNKLNNYLPNLCRGVLKKSGAGVNGIYNQDFGPYVLLLEVGGENNTIEEVNNSLKILALVINEIIKEE